MRRFPTFWISGRLVLTAVLAGLAVPASAAGLPHCGSLGQPACVEAPPPGVELRLSPEENPLDLQPLPAHESGELLWPTVRGHKPYGFNAASTDATHVEQAMLTQQVGGSIARVSVDWGWVQYYPDDSRGRQPWHYEEHVDPIYKAYVKRGIRPLLDIVKAPRRFTRHAATPRSTHVRGCGTSDACHAPPLAEHLDELETFAKDLAKRYPLAAGIEVWNEPNIADPFWAGDPPDPEHYTRMLAAAHSGVKAARPSMRVLGGALANYLTSTTDPQGYPIMSMRMFLGRMLLAGASDHMDAVSYHPYFGPYPSDRPTLAQQDQDLFNRMTATDTALKRAYTDTGSPLVDRVVASELGASTTDGFTEERQSAWLRLRYWGWDVDHPYLVLPVDAALFHNPAEDLDPPHGQVSIRGLGWSYTPDPDAGTRNFVPKQVYCTFRTEFGGFSDCPAWMSVDPIEEPPPAPEPPSSTEPPTTAEPPTSTEPTATDLSGTEPSTTPPPEGP